MGRNHEWAASASRDRTARWQWWARPTGSICNCRLRAKRRQLSSSWARRLLVRGTASPAPTGSEPGREQAPAVLLGCQSGQTDSPFGSKRLLRRLQPAYHDGCHQAKQQSDAGDDIVRSHGQQGDGRSFLQQSDRSARGRSTKEQERRYGDDFDCEHGAEPPLLPAKCVQMLAPFQALRKHLSPRPGNDTHLLPLSCSDCRGPVA